MIVAAEGIRWGENVLFFFSAEHRRAIAIGQASTHMALTSSLVELAISGAVQFFSQRPESIHQVWASKVCASTYKAEKSAWENWNREQSEAEANLLRTT